MLDPGPSISDDSDSELESSSSLLDMKSSSEDLIGSKDRRCGKESGMYVIDDDALLGAKSWGWKTVQLTG